MLSGSALKSMNVLFTTPCYVSGVTMNYAVSCFDLIREATRRGLNFNTHLHSESLVTRARNEIVKFFLANEEYTHLFFIDSDIAFRPEAAFRLLLANRDIASAIYPIKRFNWPAEGLPAGMTREQFEAAYTDYPFNPIGYGATKSVADLVDKDGFLEVAEAPTGFMAIKRHVFYDMMRRYPELQYVPDGPADNPLAKFYWLFFDCMVDPDSGRYLSEDYAFCRRWRDMGGKVYADLNSEIVHLGQHLFRGNLAESLRAQGKL
jgi:hypothetical protein